MACPLPDGYSDSKADSEDSALKRWEPVFFGGLIVLVAGMAVAMHYAIERQREAEAVLLANPRYDPTVVAFLFPSPTPTSVIHRDLSTIRAAVGSIAEQRNILYGGCMDVWIWADAVKDRPELHPTAIAEIKMKAQAAMDEVHKLQGKPPWKVLVKTYEARAAKEGK